MLGRIVGASELLYTVFAGSLFYSVSTRCTVSARRRSGEDLTSKDRRESDLRFFGGFEETSVFVLQIPN